MALETRNGWPDPNGLTKEKLAEIVMQVQGYLWADEAGAPDPRKETSTDELDAIAEAMTEAGLAPEEAGD